MRGAVFLVVLAAALSQRFATAPESQPSRGAPTVVHRYHLPPIGLGASQSRTWPGRVRDDRGLMLGGIFSGLCHVPGDPQSIFYCAADRGPNSDVQVGAQRRRTFPVPEYSPLIYRIRAEGDWLRILEQIGIRSRRGAPVSGLPNTRDDETPHAFDGRAPVALDPNGLDVEGLAVGRDRTFWIADEYRPSLARLARDGTVLDRLIPRGVTLPADTEVRPVLPAIYARRRLNRGFEGVALSPDGSRLFAVMESPLEFPDRRKGRASRMVRILVLDARRMAPIAEHVYVSEPAGTFGEASQGEMRLGDVACIDHTTLLVVERGQKRSRVFRADLGGASSILGSAWDDPRNTGDALEALTPARLRQRGVVPVRKSLVVDVGALAGVPSKIEGLAIVNPTTLAIGNDNDFGFSGFDPRGRAVRTALRTTLTLVRIPRPSGER